MSEHPSLTANEAITESRRIMNGNKCRLFCLDFSFIGWELLCSSPLYAGGFLVLKYFTCLVYTSQLVAICYALNIKEGPSYFTKNFQKPALLNDIEMCIRDSLTGEIQMCINVACRADVAVPQPLLNLLQAHAIGIEQTLSLIHI